MDAYLDVREAAEELGISSGRPVRLTWQLGVWSHERCIPHEQVERIKRDAPVEECYAALRTWLLRSCQPVRANAPGSS